MVDSKESIRWILSTLISKIYVAELFLNSTNRDVIASGPRSDSSLDFRARHCPVTSDAVELALGYVTDIRQEGEREGGTRVSCQQNNSNFLISMFHVIVVKTQKKFRCLFRCRSKTMKNELEVKTQKSERLKSLSSQDSLTSHHSLFSVSKQSLKFFKAKMTYSK